MTVTIYRPLRTTFWSSWRTSSAWSSTSRSARQPEPSGHRHRLLPALYCGRRRLGALHPLPPPTPADPQRSCRSRRDRRPTPGATGAATSPRGDRPRDARRTRSPAVAAQRARRCPRLPPGRVGRGGRRRRRDHPRQRPSGVAGPPRSDRRTAGAGRRAPAADLRRSADPGRGHRARPESRSSWSSMPPATFPTTSAVRRTGSSRKGLTNALKHAPGEPVRIQRGRCPRQRVGGRGGQSGARHRRPGDGQGLRGLTERAALVDGRLEHGRTPEGDFRLAAWLPWPA